MVRTLGLIAAILGAAILAIGAFMAWQIFAQAAVLCPDDPACGDARSAGWIALMGAVSGGVTLAVGLLLRRRGE